MRLGILDLLALGATLLFALPIGAFGVQLLLRGEALLGAVGVGVAVGLVVAEQFLWTPGDLPSDAAAVAGRLLGRPPEE
ncbi:MAG: hypothetical protein ABEJ67_03255 [Halanaeroarchaeum sp.]